MSLLTRVIVAHTCAFLILIGLTVTTRSTLGLGEVYPHKAAALFLVLTLVCLALVARHHPFARYGAGNLVTLMRAALLSAVAALIAEPIVRRVAMYAAITSFVIVILDGVDGWLARRSGTVSAFGARFDVETDAALIMTLTILVWQHGKAGVWVLLCGLMRYLFIAAGWPLPWMAGPLEPTRRAKTVAVIQMAALSSALVPVVPASVSVSVTAVALATLTWSFAIDVGRLWRSRPRAVRD